MKFLHFDIQKTVHQKVLSITAGLISPSKFYKKMKHAVLISLSLFLALAACQNAQPKAETKPETTAAPAPAAEPAATAPAASEAVFACPMHPEITGKMGDKCSKCKMDLKPVKK